MIIHLEYMEYFQCFRLQDVNTSAQGQTSSSSTLRNILMPTIFIKIKTTVLVQKSGCQSTKHCSAIQKSNCSCSDSFPYFYQKVLTGISWTDEPITKKASDWSRKKEGTRKSSQMGFFTSGFSELVLCLKV